MEGWIIKLGNNKLIDRGIKPLNSIVWWAPPISHSTETMQTQAQNPTFNMSHSLRHYLLMIKSKHHTAPIRVADPK